MDPRCVTTSQMEVSPMSRKKCKRSRPMWTCTQIWWNRSSLNLNMLQNCIRFNFPGSVDDLCPISWSVERHSRPKIAHCFPFLWQLPHLHRIHSQRLLLWQTLCWVLVDWRGEFSSITSHSDHLCYIGSWGNVWLLGDLFPGGVRLCGWQHFCWVEVLYCKCHIQIIFVSFWFLRSFYLSGLWEFQLLTVATTQWLQ